MANPNREYGAYGTNASGLSIVLFAILSLFLMNSFRRTGAESPYQLSVMDSVQAHALRFPPAVRCNLPDSVQRKQEFNGYYFISATKLKKICVGRSFEEIDRMFRPADVFVSSSTDSGTTGEGTAFFYWLAMVTEKGNFCSAEMHFNSAGICDSVEPSFGINRSNTWLLGHLPFVQSILGWKWLTDCVQESPYGYYQPKVAWIFRLCFALLIGLLYVAWFVLPGLLLVGFYYAVLPLSYMRRLPLWAPQAIAVLPAVLGCYFWAVGLLAWGLHWFFALFIVGDTMIAAVWFSVSIPNEATTRCPKCRRVGSVCVVGTRLVLTRRDVKIEEENLGFDHKDVSYYQQNKTWTEEDWKSTDVPGKPLYWKIYYKGVATIRREVSFYKVRQYEVKYDVPIYIDTLRCKACGHQYDDKKYEGDAKFVSRNLLRTVLVKRGTRDIEESVSDVVETNREYR